MTMTSSHLPDSALLALAARPDARLPRAALARLGSCGRCSGDLEDLRLLAESVRDPWAEPPTDVLDRVYALVEPPPPRRAEWRRVPPARLVFQGGLAAASPAGLRAPVGIRHEVWHAAGAEVDLRIQGPGLGARALLLGQVLPRSSRRAMKGAGTLWYFEPGRPVRTHALNETGEFSLPAPRGARWALWIEWGALRLRIEKKKRTKQ